MAISILFQQQLTLYWDAIPKFRDFFHEMLAKSYKMDKMKAGRIVLIISELLENVVKYTSDKTCFLDLTLQENDFEKIVVISIENNRSTISELDYLDLLETVTSINSYDDYEKMYLDYALKYLDDPDGKSKLGIAMMRNLSEGHPIEVSRGDKYSPGIVIRVKIDV